MKKKFKCGDNVYFEFSPCVISRMEDGKVRQVEMGHGTISSCDMKVFAPTDRVKKLSEQFKEMYLKIRDAGGNVNINCPSISSYLADTWEKACETGNDDHLVVALAFTGSMVKEIGRMRDKDVMGVKVLR